jgi:hypothetical protein
MEDVLEVYQRPHDPHRPVVCLDETTKQLIKETRVPVPAKSGRPARHDYEYERNGTANLFMLFAPLEGWRHVEVTDRHTALDYAQVLKALSDRHFPGASKIVLVQDNLSTHKPASLYEAFPAAEARRLVERFEWHYTPKHGSWLDMAESELSVLSGQCLDRRIPDKPTLIEEVAAWQKDRNKKHSKADWVRRETGKRQEVKVHHGEGVAIHIDPESCAGGREAAREALTGARAGQPLSGERPHNRSADVIQSAEGNTAGRAIASTRSAPRHRRPWHARRSLAREPRGLRTATGCRSRGRTGKARCRSW